MYNNHRFFGYNYREYFYFLKNCQNQFVFNADAFIMIIIIIKKRIDQNRKENVFGLAVSIVHMKKVISLMVSHQSSFFFLTLN